MIDGPFRSMVPQYSGWLITLYSRLRLTPNHVTWLGFGCGLLASAMVALGNFMPALALWWLGRVFDGTDGVYARSTGRVSAFGGYLDIVLDMAAYGAMIIGFSIQFPDQWLMWIMIEFFYILCITTARPRSPIPFF